MGDSMLYFLYIKKCYNNIIYLLNKNPIELKKYKLFFLNNNEKKIKGILLSPFLNSNICWINETTVLISSVLDLVFMYSI